MRRSLSLIVVLLIAAVVAGCGTNSSSSGPSFKGAQQSVATVFSNLSSDARNSEAGTICNKLFSAQLVARLNATGESCATVVANQLDNIDDFTESVNKVTVTGNTATAIVQSKNDGKEVTNTFTLGLVGGTWRILSLG